MEGLGSGESEADGDPGEEFPLALDMLAHQLVLNTS